MLLFYCFPLQGSESGARALPCRYLAFGKPPRNTTPQTEGRPTSREHDAPRTTHSTDHSLDARGESNRKPMVRNAPVSLRSSLTTSAREVTGLTAGGGGSTVH